MTELQERIVNLLKQSAVGRINAITAKNLAALTGTPGREVREAIAELRRMEYAIASSVQEPFGFFIPATVAEARETLRHMWNRMTAIYETTKGYEAGVKRLFPAVNGQLDLDLKETA